MHLYMVTYNGAEKSNLTDRSFMRENIEFHWTTKNIKCNENNWNSKFTYDEKSASKCKKGSRFFEASCVDYWLRNTFWCFFRGKHLVFSKKTSCFFKENILLLQGKRCVFYTLCGFHISAIADYIDGLSTWNLWNVTYHAKYG